MNVGKAYGLAKLPVLVIIGLGILAYLIGAIPGLNVLLCILGLPLLIVDVILYAYIGYLIAKGGLEIIDSAVMGALTALVSGIIGMIISLVAGMLGLGAGAGLGVDIIVSVIGIVTWMVIGAVLALIGHVIAGAMAKKK